MSESSSSSSLSSSSSSKQATSLDLSENVEKKISEYLTSGASGNFQSALEKLFNLEKQTRIAADFVSTRKVAKAIVQLCFKSGDFKQLSDSLILISKRRGQDKKVISAAVEEAMQLLAHISSRQDQLSIINTLRTVTEGKMFVELQRAELTKQLASMYEADGDIKKAATILQEIQVETLSTMEKKEKIEFILEQIRLCLESKDYNRAEIISRNINLVVLKEADHEFLKVRFYTLMITFYSYKQDHIQIARCYQQIYNTPHIQESTQLWTKYLKLAIVFGILSPFSNDQHDIVNRFSLDKKTRELPVYKKLLQLFLTLEIISWEEIVQNYLQTIEEVVPEVADPSHQLTLDLHSRVIQHNIRVISGYYNRINTGRFAELLGLSVEESELNLSAMVSDGTVTSRIDRPRRLIYFRSDKDPNQVLNDWSSNIKDLLELIEKTCHLVQRDRMVYGVDK